jgi:hypothetical protein
MLDHGLHRPGLRKKVGRAGHDLEQFWCSQLAERFLVQLDHPIVVATDDEQGWRTDHRKRVAGKVRASAA